MTTFDERERAFENKFAHDAEMQFKASAAATRNLCLWAANRFGLEGEAAVDYARRVLTVWLERPGVDHVLDRLAADARERDVALDEAEIRREHERLLAETKATLIGDPA